MRRAPALTKKVLRGLDAIRAAVEAGDMLNGDLAHKADAVQAALEWIDRIHDYRKTEGET